MKCEELLAMLNEYVDGTVDPAICEEFEKHMAGCNPCQVVVDNVRKTITLYKDGQPYAMPMQFREKMHDALTQKVERKISREVISLPFCRRQTVRVLPNHASNFPTRASFVTYFQSAAQCQHEQVVEQLGLDSGRRTDSHQCLAVASGQPMVAAADVSRQCVFGCLRHHRPLPGKEFF